MKNTYISKKMQGVSMMRATKTQNTSIDKAPEDGALVESGGTKA